MPIRRIIPRESAADVAAALAPGQQVSPRPIVRRQASPPRVPAGGLPVEVRATSPAEMVQRVAAAAAGGPVVLSANGQEIAQLGASVREVAINQTLDGMRRAGPAMISITREIIQGMIDNTPGYDPENDQLALALARYDAENAPAVPAADPEPDEPTPPPVPSRPVRRWED